jgi:hypothetical protein
MSLTGTNKTINSQYILITLVAVAASWILHELAHWKAGTLLGYDMGMTLNKAFPIIGKFNSDGDYQVVSAAGPALTLIEALVVFLIMYRKKIIALYPFLVTCFYMRLFAAVISIRHANDEARISKSIGLGTYTLPIIMAAILLILVYKISGKYKFSRGFMLITLGLIILFSSIIILSDQFFHIRLL